MNVTFPSQVSSVSDWLTQINLAKYVPSFESAGILNVAELPLLTHALKSGIRALLT